MKTKPTEPTDIVKKINEEPESPFSVFLAIELHDRYEERSIEEKHLTFDQWRQLYFLREEKELESKKRRKNMEMLKERLHRLENTLESTRKNKELYKNMQDSIPPIFKQMSTKELLRLRFSYPYEAVYGVSTDALYAELANRPHIKNKNDRKEVFTKKEKKIMK